MREGYDVPADVVHFDGAAPHAQQRQAQRCMSPHGSEVQARVAGVVHVPHHVANVVHARKLHDGQHRFGDAADCGGVVARSTVAIGAAQDLVCDALADGREERGQHVDVSAHARAVQHGAALAVEQQHELSLSVFVSCRVCAVELIGSEHIAVDSTRCAVVLCSQSLAAACRHKTSRHHELLRKVQRTANFLKVALVDQLFKNRFGARGKSARSRP
jgi:hypothetical protein